MFLSHFIKDFSLFPWYSASLWDFSFPVIFLSFPYSSHSCPFYPILSPLLPCIHSLIHNLFLPLFIERMTTELRQQLNAIALPEIGSKKTVTLIFTPEEARNQTIETIYNIGKNGLYELIRLDPNFLRFDTTLFGIKMRTMDRFLETEKVNEELNKLIHDFLCTLSPYIMLKASQKCLEYLFRHFSIHTLNVSDVVMCILPYHETSLFPKIVSLLSVENDSLWYFLTNIKRSKAPLLRQYLGNQCSKDQGLLEYILNYITEMNNEGFNMNMHLTLVSALIFDYTKSHTVFPPLSSY